MKPRFWMTPLFMTCATYATGAPVQLQNATATFSQLPDSSKLDGWTPDQAIDGIFGDNNGWAIARPLDVADAYPQTLVFETVSNIGFVTGTLLSFSLYQLHFNAGHSLGDFRLSYTTDDRNSFADGLSSNGNISANWILIEPMLASSTGGAILSVQGDSSILASGPLPATAIYTITAKVSELEITGFRLEALADASLPHDGPGRFPDNGNFGLTEFTLDAAALPVPEPSTQVLLGLGMLMIALRRLAKVLRSPLAPR